MGFMDWVKDKFFVGPIDIPPQSNPFKSGVAMRGMFNAYLYGPDGDLKEERHVPNIITLSGESHVADQMSDQGEGAMSHMAVGTSGTGPAAGNTTLGGELDRNALSGATQAGGGTAANNVRYTANWTAGDGTGAIAECGIFNAATAGIMLARVCFSVINKGAADTLAVKWDIAFDDDGV